MPKQSGPIMECATNGTTADGRRYVYSATHNGYIFLPDPQTPFFDSLGTLWRWAGEVKPSGQWQAVWDECDCGTQPCPSHGAFYAEQAALARVAAPAPVTRCPGTCDYVQAPHSEACYVSPGPCSHPTPTTLDGITDESGQTAYYPPF